MPASESMPRCCATMIGWWTSACMASSSRLTASSPPQDVPIAMTSYTSRDLPVDPFGLVERLVLLRERREGDGLLVAENEDPERFEALVEKPVHAILQHLVEVDHHVAAEDHVELVETTVHREVVLREDDVFRQLAHEAHVVVRGEVVLGEVSLAPRTQVVLRVLLHALEREHAFACGRQHVLVDVGCVDARAVVQALLAQQDRE